MVKGKVTYNGEPLVSADVEFVPKTDLSIGGFMAQTEPDGTFEVKLGKGTGRYAWPGSFVVLITKGSARASGMPPPEDLAGLSEEDRTMALMKGGPGVGKVGKASSTSYHGILPERYSNKTSCPFKFELSEGPNDIGTLKLDGPPLKK